MIQHVLAENMTISKLTEDLNKQALKFHTNRGKNVTIENLIEMAEMFLLSNDNIKNITKIKIITLVDFLKSETD